VQFLRTGALYLEKPSDQSVCEFRNHHCVRFSAKAYSLAAKSGVSPITEFSRAAPATRYYHGCGLPEHDLRVVKQVLEILIDLAELREQFTGFGGPETGECYQPDFSDIGPSAKN
jgi:hypothetical protein